MFEKKRTIFFLTKSTIRVATSKCGGGAILPVGEYPWCQETLEFVLGALPGSLPKTARIVLSDALGYVVPIRRESGIDRKDAEAEAEGSIPENLEDTAWDFRCIVDHKTGQVAALLPDVSALVSRVFTSWKIESVELESVALARASGDPEGIILFREEGDILIAHENGRVLATEALEERCTDAHVAEFASFVENRFSKKLSGVSVSEGALEGDMEQKLRERGFSVESKPLNPLLGALAKKDISGKDQNVLNILFTRKRKGTISGKPPGRSFSTREKILLVLFLLSVASGIAVFFAR